jgi:predicted ABC-type transport system involved in lysophospholipase L1 biosynthesis ATPase subunit
VTAVLELAGISHDYRALRPLRIAELRVGAGERVAILGIDAAAAEVFVNLATGASLPDAGRVALFGRDTSAIGDSTDWLATVDRVGIVSDRAVLLEQLTVIQNLAMPFTLAIEPPSDDVRTRAAAIAQEVRLPEARWNRPVNELDTAGKVRVRLARAIALDPAILLLEHVSAAVERAAVQQLGGDMAAVAAARGSALVALSADDVFARAAATRVLALQPATGALKEKRLGWF